MLPIAEHALDATNYEAPKAAAIIFQDPVQPNNIGIIVGAVCGLCVLVVGIVVAIVIVRHSKYTLVCFFILVNIICFYLFK